MKMLANVKIGKKLAYVLGGCVLLLAGMSGLALWGLRNLQQYEDISNQRLTQALLIERSGRWLTAANIQVRTMIGSNSVSQESRDEMARIRKEYLNALSELKATSHSATGRLHAADLDDPDLENIVQQYGALNDR